MGLEGHQREPLNFPPSVTLKILACREISGQNSHTSMVSGHYNLNLPTLALVLVARVMSPPDSCWSENWDPKGSNMIMLPETLAPPWLQPPLWLPNSLLQGHILRIPPPIHPFHLLPHPKKKGQRPISSSLPTFLPPYLSMPQPSSWTPSTHCPSPSKSSHLFSYQVSPNPSPFLPSPRGSVGADGIIRVHVPFSFQDLSQIEKRLGSFSANPCVYIKEFGYLSQAYDLTCIISMSYSPPL